jgi:hypothetical protein
MRLGPQDPSPEGEEVEPPRSKEERINPAVMDNPASKLPGDGGAPPTKHDKENRAIGR